ncbi:MAG: hypothetical protein JWO20_36 [Candidatus Angelobacter sp.]|jgi:hypothetical protein|nr:hypothetical protein [Candidatus Angelobacter sp.]
MSDDKKHIHIISKNGKVDHEDQPINKKGEEAVWVSDTGDAYQVVFRDGDCPFDKNTFDVPAGGSIGSGPARDDAKEKPYQYKYDVVGPGGTNDPTIIIQR